MCECMSVDNWMKAEVLLFFGFNRLSFCSITRRVWRGVQRPPEAAEQEGDLRGHQDAERGLHGQTEEGLPRRGVNHGTV